LANHLAPLLNNLVATNQSAFIKGRRIHDNFMLVQQTIKVLHHPKISSLFLKLDISKAFDSVDWSFLLENIVTFGFWIHLANHYLQFIADNIYQNYS
jgi:hypothetical protein